MNILITGATGFIGQHLLEELDDDDLQIKIISRQQNPKFWCTNRNFKIFHADISDKQSLKDAFSNTDIVINLAAELKSAQNFESTNILGVKNIVELSQKNNAKKIIHLSSVGVVGMQYSLTKVVVDENTACHPQSGYERTKLESEKIISNSKIPFVILRPTNVFGDHHPRKALLGFLQRVKARKSFPMTKDAVVNYVYVKDVVHAIRYCLKNDIGSKIFNVGQTIPFNDFLSVTSAQMSSPYKSTTIPKVFFSLMEMTNYFGIENLKARMRGISNEVCYADTFMQEQVGYKYGISAGIKKTINFYLI